MKSSVRLAVVVALATLALTGLAEAHTLKISRAAKANATFTRLLCSGTNDPDGTCVSSSPGGCSRISEHRVRCSLYITLEAKDKSQARCRGLLEWVIPGDGNAIRPDFLGFRSCTGIRGPQPEPIPVP
jgi:hypothetical protein